jgi:hypothetical protein
MLCFCIWNITFNPVFTIESFLNKNMKTGSLILTIICCSQLLIAQKSNSEVNYFDILKKGQEYNYSDERFIPEFTYLSKEDSNLVKTRLVLKLDSVAGKANEISRILNILHWVHFAAWHDGEANNPTSKNALDLISYCKTQSRGMTCRMMATILNECYLSLGIKSRIVTCMPKEIKFDECHVINAVYCNQLNKWLWIDPTFDAYVMDDKGVLLGIEEVRERLTNKQPIILNPEANWNRLTSQLKEDYLERYMTKNLYRLECQVASGYNTETWFPGKEISYIELLPLDGLGQDIQRHEEIVSKTGVKFIYYKTNNPDLFWTKP